MLTFVNRGDHVTIETFPGTQLDNPYSMNVIDICPVGALTSRDFRFRARVWDMSFNDTICPGCARGCNIQAGVRNNEILRLEPRTNMKVNEYWMCDPGRLGEDRYVNENRVERPLVKRDGVQYETGWDEALGEAARMLRGIKPQEIAFIGSPFMSCEENYTLAKFAREVVGASNIDLNEYIDPSFADKKLRLADRTPNTRGAREVGIAPDKSGQDIKAIAEGIKQGRIRALYVLDQSLPVTDDIASAIAGLDVLIVHAWNPTAIASHANIVFATSTYAEKEGTFVNANGMVQHFMPAVVTQENERLMGMKMSRLDKFGAYNDRWTHGDRRECRPAWAILRDLAQQMGTRWDYGWSEDVVEEMANRFPGFRSMTYDMLEENFGVELGKGDRPTPHGFRYIPHDLRPQQMPTEQRG
ncbi:MAG: molybdopterin-dependent oxidoreductase [bacterium]|nr:molybdopterin-dependent oxidoreductase [Candidatus Kapabacteria bacterium]